MRPYIVWSSVSLSDLTYCVPLAHSAAATLVFLLFLERNSPASALAFPFVWNALPVDIRLANFLMTVKSLIQCHFLSEATLIILLKNYNSSAPNTDIHFILTYLFFLSKTLYFKIYIVYLLYYYLPLPVRI